MEVPGAALKAAVVTWQQLHYFVQIAETLAANEREGRWGLSRQHISTLLDAFPETWENFEWRAKVRHCIGYQIQAAMIFANVML